MGLDISAYDYLDFRKIDMEEDNEEDYSLTYIFKNTDFPESSSGLKTGFYKHNGENEIRFRAGSYSGYNHWRNLLCELVNNVSADEVFDKFKTFDSLDKDLKMMELIFFSDCEGYIGTEQAKKLLIEFKENEQLAINFSETEQDNYFLENYTAFKTAFEIASNGGAVLFH